MSRNIGGKNGEVFNGGVLSQIKPSKEGFDIVTHLDHLPDKTFDRVHVDTNFDIFGNLIGTKINIKK